MNDADLIHYQIEGVMKDKEFKITDHVCGECHGRILKCSNPGMSPGGDPLWVCADCEEATYVINPSKICACGSVMRGQNEPVYECRPITFDIPKEANIFAMMGYPYNGKQKVGFVLRSLLSAGKED